MGENKFKVKLTRNLPKQSLTMEGYAPQSVSAKDLRASIQKDFPEWFVGLPVLTEGKRL